MTIDHTSAQTGQVTINREVCSGHARCVVLAPRLFDIDDDGLSTVQRQPADVAEYDDARRAASGCPERAITIVEAS
ncbi:MAG TPA: ferredoxin [Jatrophihabitantaceae bacterium]|jgi:ferredoxin|nr:ferredoxin [Jatrophihabitantaceae bacterium]